MGKEKGSIISPHVIENLSNSLGPLFPIGFLILFLFLTIYNIHQIIDVDGKDEDFIDCTCRNNDKNMYRGLFWSLTSLWIIIVLGWQIIRFTDCYKLYVQLCVLP